MRCAVSFVTVTVLSIAVGAIAVYIIVITGKVEDCEAGYYCMVKNVSKCIKPCNGDEECDDKSDEAPIYCNDLSTTRTMIDIFLKCVELDLEDRYRNQVMMSGLFNSSKDNDYEVELNATTASELEFLVEDKPDECDYLRANNTPPKGVGCYGRNTNLTWGEGIPWQQISSFSRTVSINGVLNITLLKGQNISEPRDYPLMDKFFLENNFIEQIGSKALCHINNVCLMTLRGNAIREISQDAFCAMNELVFMKLTNNKMTLKGFYFRDMPRLMILYLDHNEIEEINMGTFRELESLQMLNLSYNKIRYIHPKAFESNDKLIEIDLTGNRLKTLAPTVFQSQQNLTKLYISQNPDLYLDAALFFPLRNLLSLNVETFDISQMDMRAFRHTPTLDIVYFKKFSYCKFLPKARRCHPSSDGLSSATNLLIGQSRIAVWCVGLLTLLGNVFVLANRWSRRRARSGRSEITDILNIFVTNLAVSDFLMGVYLIILAVKDVQFRGIYHRESFNWATSWLCSFTGVIAMISSEVSLLTLTIMSLERYLTIGGPFSQRQNLNVNLARASMLIIWLFASTLALAPAVQWHTEQTLFYGSTGLCFPIHLDDPYPLGWQYTAFVFIGVNTACLALITVSYSLLFRSVQFTQRQTPLMKKNIELAMRFFLMVVTDVLCWAPIIILKWAVFSGYILPKEVIGWVVIYILPLNSAVNPVLYTFSTREVRNTMTTQLNKLLENLELNRLIPSTTEASNAMELQGVSRNWLMGRRSLGFNASNRRGTDQTDTPVVTTGHTDDTELTHSTCPTILTMDCSNAANNANLSTNPEGKTDAKSSQKAPKIEKIN